ncbi:hypothetical protein ETU10_04555 [Apibacter muscae]|uniref:hypothetical protein n=1 Tax=Apibacter muscae TaxID=2509004 RepID=UPI0011AD81D8|nr:hypothetical protein [Apibacter muscae]TWP23956.1 hypothetical protein ETU10_04555 [Apibacter muscae]
MKKTFLILYSIFFIILSCNKEYKVIDGSSKESFDLSLKSISSKLTILQQDKLEEAIKLIYKFKTDGDDENQRWEKLYSILNDKSSEQVFEMAEEIAKENKISWSSTSMIPLDPSILRTEEKKLSEEEKNLQQLESATSISIRFSTINSDPELNEGFYIYPKLVDDSGQEITFNNLPLNFSISFINNGTVVYTTNRTLSSSFDLNKGLKFMYNLFDKEKIINSSLDVEVKTSAGDKYLYGKLAGIPIEVSKTKDSSSSIEDELDNQLAVKNVNNFIQLIGDKKYSEAYKLSKNPKWGDEEKFSSTSNGFGTIEAVNILSSDLINRNKDEITVFSIYQIKDKSGKIKSLKQNFKLHKINGDWLITDTQTKEVTNDDSWK